MRPGEINLIFLNKSTSAIINLEGVLAESVDLDFEKVRKMTTSGRWESGRTIVQLAVEKNGAKMEITRRLKGSIVDVCYAVVCWNLESSPIAWSEIESSYQRYREAKLPFGTKYPKSEITENLTGDDAALLVEPFEVPWLATYGDPFLPAAEQDDYYKAIDVMVSLGFVLCEAYAPGFNPTP